MEPRCVEDALQLLTSEYLNTPEPSLTPGEVAQLLDIDPLTATVLLQGLEDLQFLEQTSDGRFISTVDHD